MTAGENLLARKTRGRRTGDLATWIKRHNILSLITNASALLMLNRVSEWGMAYANSSTKSGTEIALVIAAVGVPATSFAGWVYKTYKENS